MPERLYDAHVHLADPRLGKYLSSIVSAYDEMGLGKAVIIGTSPDDWEAVLEIAGEDPRFIRAIGLHPWRVKNTPEGWQAQFLAFLDRGVRVIGEIGLDQWVEGYDIDRQEEAFRWQLKIAAERNLPTSIHCLKAHEPLLHTLRDVDLPERGIKLHAYNGPADTIKPLLDLGAYFSFNAGQLKPNAKNVRQLIRLVPDDRILIETDAPDFLPPGEHREFDLDGVATTHDEPIPEKGSRPPGNHPANIRAGYRALAELRGQAMDELTKKVALNFERYFES